MLTGVCVLTHILVFRYPARFAHTIHHKNPARQDSLPLSLLLRIYRNFVPKKVGLEVPCVPVPGNPQKIASSASLRPAPGDLVQLRPHTPILNNSLLATTI